MVVTPAGVRICAMPVAIGPLVSTSLGAFHRLDADDFTRKIIEK